MSRPRAIVHIGTHRTGTTSLQGFLGAADRSLLRPQGFRYYSGIRQAAGHVELHMAAMRDGRSSPARRSFGSIARSTVTGRVQSFLALAGKDVSVFSGEGLSYLRHPDEIEALKEVFGGADVRIILYLREKQSFLRSYRAFLEEYNLRTRDDPRSFGYAEEDSWLLDYDALVEAYERGFGRRNVTVLKYEREIARHGGVVGSFLAAIGVQTHGAEVAEPRLRAAEGAGVAARKPIR
jgi:hypothetical protein